MRVYDKKHNRLIYIKKTATELYWDQHWDKKDYARATMATPNSWIVKVTKKYLSQNSKILEGGCGLANHVYALRNNGYKATGIDYAPLTVQKVLEAHPELDIIFGDVRKLPFGANSFDGYWSLGVIEHFWDGYKEIAVEMKRVIRPGGYLFLTFPQISSLRMKKIKKGEFIDFVERNDEPEEFYQFALDPKKVIDDFITMDFELINKESRDGLKGMKDECHHFKSSLKNLYNSQNSFVKKLISKYGDLLNYGHICLIVFKKI